jgi:hypothetical protein
VDEVWIQDKGQKTGDKGSGPQRFYPLSFILLLLSLVLCRLPINHLKLKESERTGLESE